MNTIDREFIAEQTQFAHDYLEETAQQIMEEFLSIRQTTETEITAILGALLEQFRLDHPGDKPQYIHFSYLRTGVLLHTAPYRVDVYGVDWFLGFRECFSEWNPQFVFRHLYGLKELLEGNFNRQTRVPNYEIDRILLDCADRLNEAVLYLFPLILKKNFQQDSFAAIYSGNKMKFYFGEFFDQIKLLYDWGSGDGLLSNWAGSQI